MLANGRSLNSAAIRNRQRHLSKKRHLVSLNTTRNVGLDIKARTILRLNNLQKAMLVISLQPMPE
jgi:hypothetical protein